MDTSSGEPAPGGRARKRWWPLLIAALAFAGIAMVTLTLRDDTPRLTRDAYEAARARWERHALSDYTIDLLKELDRQAPERLRTAVRGGRATSLTVNDAAVRTSDTYTVRGLFDIIERELEMADSKERQPGQPSEVALRAVFDEATGRPLIFKRLAGRGRSVILTVTSFKVAEPEAQPENDETR